MELEDIAAVMEVERQSFSTPWPGHAYRRELKENRLARYVVARRTGPLPPEEDGQGGSEDRSASPRGRGWRSMLSRLLDAIGGPVEMSPEAEERARRVVGYAGFWLMVDEAHITAIAVSPVYRGLGLGDLLLLSLIDLAQEMGAHYLTLEVRASNTLAQNLYRKYGFKETGVRRRYYSDDNEDALIMWSDPLESADFREMVERHRRTLLERLRSPQTVAKLQSRAARA